MDRPGTLAKLKRGEAERLFTQFDVNRLRCGTAFRLRGKALAS